MALSNVYVTGEIGAQAARLPAIATLFQIGVDNALIQVPQNYTVPANPPSEPNPPNNLAVPTTNTQITTTSDSVTIYLSAIKGFSNSLQMSFIVQPITSDLAASLGWTLSPLDSTTAAWQGSIGSTSINWVSASSGPLPFTMQANTTNSLNTYLATNYQTLWINPGNSGVSINPSHPPSYLVSIFAFDPLTFTYAACNFTIVVVPSIANYGLGVYVKSYVPPAAVPQYVNSVTLSPNGFASSPQNAAILYYVFYPLEPARVAPSALNITIDYFDNPIIDLTNSVVSNPDGPYAVPPNFPISLGSYTQADGLGAIASGFTRDSPCGNLPDSLGSHALGIILYLNNHLGADGAKPLVSASLTPPLNHGLLEVTATDDNGVSVSAYTAIYIAGEISAT
jgi:hypothetical protein